MGNEDSAESRLRTLTEFFREHPEAGRAARAIPEAKSKAPINLNVLDHIQRSHAEVVEHTHRANPAAGRPPARVEAVYGWCREQLKDSDETVALETLELEIKHRLQHAIAMGDATAVVRPIRCPACETFGLFWLTKQRRALCRNRYCARENKGVHRLWTIPQLARRESMYEMALRECAT